MQAIVRFTDVDLRQILFFAAVVVVAVAGGSLLVPQKKEPPAPAKRAEPEEFDPFAGGYPVPPLPGQQLPPSPRRRTRVTAGVGGAPSGTDQATGSATEHETETEVQRG